MLIELAVLSADIRGFVPCAAPVHFFHEDSRANSNSSSDLLIPKGYKGKMLHNY